MEPAVPSQINITICCFSFQLGGEEGRAGSLQCSGSNDLAATGHSWISARHLPGIAHMGYIHSFHSPLNPPSSGKQTTEQSLVVHTFPEQPTGGKEWERERAREEGMAPPLEVV